MFSQHRSGLKAPLLLCALCCLWQSRAFATDVSVYLVKRGLEYLQTNSNPPAINITNGYGFAAEVDLTAEDTVTNASFQPPLGLPSQPLDLAGSHGKFDYSKKYNTLTSLQIHWPDGAYTFTIKARNDGPSHPALNLSGTTFPKGPRIGNFHELKSVNPNGYTKIVWDPWPNGGSGDYIQFRIQDPAGNKLFETPDIGKPYASDGTAIQALIGPGLLSTGQVNSATLSFEKHVSTNLTDYPGATGISSRYSRTLLPLVTTSSAPPDLKKYEISKAQKLIQTGPQTLLPQHGSEFGFQASIDTYNTGVLATATILIAPTNATRALVSQGSTNGLSFSDAATNTVLLDGAYPSGTYTLGFTAPHDGTKSIPLPLPPTDYPSAPRFLDFQSLTNVNVARALNVSWEPWPGGTVNDSIQLRVEDPQGNRIFETPDLGKMNILDGRATNAVIPAGALPADQDLEFHLTFFRLKQVDTSVYPGVLGLVDFRSRTKVLFHTFLAVDVKTYTVGKERWFHQVHTNLPAPEGFKFRSTVVATAPNAVISCAVSNPGAAVHTLVPAPGLQEFAFEDTFSTQAALDSAYPNGNYTEQIHTADEGARNLPLALTNDRYPNPPHLTDFEAAQTVASGAEFLLAWEPFLDGLASDFIQVRVSDSAGRDVFHTPDFSLPGALSGFSTLCAIPPRTLASNQWYQVTISFKKVVLDDLTSYPGALGYATYAATTWFRLLTRGSGNPPQLSLVATSPQGGFELRQPAVPGLAYRIEGSSDLIHWLPLATNTPAGNVLQWFEVSRDPVRFYRSVILP